jgi:DNA invertase Pin-like site-specific DNA recombinase
MAHIGYIRVSSVDQCAERQLDGIVLDRLFEDKAGGRDARRPALIECRNSLRAGDVLHIHSLDRPARNMAELQKLVADCVSRGAEVHFHKENLIFSGCANEKPDQCRTLMLHILGAFAAFEKSLLMERQREGRAAALKKGKIFGRPSTITPEKAEEIWTKLQAGRLAADIARECGVCRSSVYNIRRKKLDSGKA